MCPIVISSQAFHYASHLRDFKSFRRDFVERGHCWQVSGLQSPHAFQTRQADQIQARMRPSIDGTDASYHFHFEIVLQHTGGICPTPISPHADHSGMNHCFGIPHCARSWRATQNTHRGARTHDHKVKGLALCRLS